MSLEQTIRAIEIELGDQVIKSSRKSESRVYVDIAPEVVKKASSLLFETLGARFQIATGVDTREGIEVMYHWAFDGQGYVVTLRTRLPHENPEVDSIVDVCIAAEWIEREMWELLGIQFTGHPDLRHLLLADDWPDGNYPLRHKQAKLSDTEVAS